MANSRTSQPRNAIIPKRTSAGGSLSVIIAIMTLLACFVVGGVCLGYSTLDSWQSKIAREVTIQVSQGSGRDIERDLLLAADIAREAPGVKAVKIIGIDATQKLIEPWLGDDLDIADLPIPRLIAVSLNSPFGTDLTDLREKLVKAVPTAGLDDHGVWNEQITSRARVIIAVGIFLVCLILAATAITIVFATNAAMLINKDIVETLHLVGASDVFVVHQFQNHFLRIAIKSSLAGFCLAVIVFLMFLVWVEYFTVSGGANIFAPVLNLRSVFYPGYLTTLALIPTVSALAGLTSRMVAFGYLRGVAA